MIRRRLRGGDGPIAVNPRRGELIPFDPADERQAALPGWRFRTAGGHGGPASLDGAAPVRRQSASDGREFQADRGAARYAPPGAFFLIRDRALPVLTVSMSGLSVEWDRTDLPAVGTTVDGVMRPGAPAEDFPAVLEVVRVEPDRQLVAGRFVGLRGRAMDDLLAWLVRLERSPGRD